MEAFKDKVAIITGAASGIGHGLAEQCAKEGMKIVMADIEEEALFKAAEEIEATGATVLAIPTDVSKFDNIETLAQKTLASFGAIHLLFNNAGIGVGAKIWEQTQADWEWIIGVNLWGVIHGIRIFVPLMLEQDIDCHIINTASDAGLTAGAGLGAYKVTKHGIVTLSETLYYELAETKIRVSVLCPSTVNTQIMNSERNRPLELQNDSNEQIIDEKLLEKMNERIAAGISPQAVAECAFEAIKQEKFYIFTHSESKEAVQTRMEDILQDRNPTIKEDSPPEDSSPEDSSPEVIQHQE